MALQNLKTDANGNASIVDADTSATGTLAALNATLSIILNGDSSYAMEVQGTFVGTVTMERTIDGVTWRAISGAIPGPLTIVQSLSAPGAMVGHCGASASLRVNMTAYTSGSATVTLRVGSGSGAVYQIAPTQAGNNIIGRVGIDQTTPGTTNAVAVTALPALPAGANIIGASNINTANASATTALHTANVTTGLTVGSNLPITGYGTSVLKITGTFVASFAFKVSQDAGVSWDSISATQVGAGDIFTSATQPGSYRLTVAGFDLLRVEVTLTSGSITINGKSSNAVNAPKIVKLATGGLVIGALAAGTSTIGTVLPPRPSGGTAVSVPASATVVTLLAANAARSGATFYSAPGSAVLFLKLGAAASATSYNIQIAAGGYYEVPAGYSGVVTGFSATAIGSTLVGEIS